ncbi:hypothetical protein HDU88_002272 [Geranomyces variabilis]|nr:hypothetical protein HDU88_002272 [Geranomyces variabilis]
MPSLEAKTLIENGLAFPDRCHIVDYRHLSKATAAEQLDVVVATVNNWMTFYTGVARDSTPT